MKFIVSILLIAILAFAVGLYLPWWSLAVVAFVVAALIQQGALKAFLSGFLGVFLLWGILAFIIDQKNQHVLSVKVAQLLPLGGSFFLLILVTAFIGGLVGGLGAMAGSFTRTVRR